MIKHLSILGLTLIGSYNLSQATKLNSTQYCISNGGKVESMVATYDIGLNAEYGFTKKFCTFEIDGGFIAVGLDTYASNHPNIAATLMVKLKPLDPDSPLWEGPSSNPGLNVCGNLGGSYIDHISTNSGFVNNLGTSDICTFGDGSMVSSWSLIYMADGRSGYDAVKNTVRPKPLKNIKSFTHYF